MNNLRERKTDFVDVLSSKNGPVIAGIVGIIFLVGIDEIMGNRYRISYNKADGFLFEPSARIYEDASN